MWRDALQLIGRKHAAFLAASVVLLAWLALRDDTNAADLAFGGGVVAALWALTGIRAYMKRDEARREAPRGNPHAR